MKLAIIPARGGSKRIPRKNIRPFHGRPIIGWSIGAARASGLFDRIVVSTDDAEIAEIARSEGAEVPFLRPADLSDDHTGTVAVINHAIRWHLEAGMAVDDVCCIYATAPFVTASTLAEGHRLLSARGQGFAFSVTRYGFPIQRALHLRDDGTLAMFQPQHLTTRSQDLEEAYHDAGQFYWGKAQAFLDNLPLFSEHAVPVILPSHLVQDIDTLEDWRRAELMFSALRAEGAYA
jgi:N-acylneuraminate cytidylyltransferase